MHPEIEAKASYWATHNIFDKKTQKEVQTLIDKKNQIELTERFYRDLEFGTGGLRGMLGAGTNRLNIYNVRKAAYALGQYVKECFPESPKIAITYDSRNFSKTFAQAAAGVLAKSGIYCLITKELRPVPMLSFMIRHFHCQAGICITASHNPPEYNGFKVYWASGGQIVPPHDQAIIANYQQLKRYEDLEFYGYAEGKLKAMIREVSDELDTPYFSAVKSLCFQSPGKKDFKIVYSPLHGSGGFPVVEALRQYGFSQINVVPEQAKPDGDFPTVKSPNPEDVEAMEMAVDLAREIQADLMLATDPDADRIGMMVREGNTYSHFSGNQIGSLLMDFILGQLQKQNKMPANPLVVKTIVTTDLQAKIAASYGVSCEETLTGFKWICQLIEDYESGARTPYKEYVCGGEESYGFLAGTFVRDKDAIIACCIAAEMAASLKHANKTMSSALWDLYRAHGVFQETLVFTTLPGKDGAESIQKKMSHIRKFPPKQVNEIPVETMRDLSISQELKPTPTGYQPHQSIPLPAANVIQFLLEDGSKISVRPSGTEPKIKVYLSVFADVSPSVSDQQLAGLINTCQKKLLQLQDYFGEAFGHGSSIYW